MSKDDHHRSGISFCTVCMNRLHHLRETLPQNIKDNLDYNNLEHVLLDYNSQDGLGNWVKDNLSSFIETGRLQYYRTEEPNTFNMAHSRNMVCKLASRDIICLIDADNFTGRGFAHYINTCFRQADNIFLTAINKVIDENPKDVLGRIALRKKDFIKVQGFDERMVSYGFEDYDLANRLELSGLERKLIQPSYLNAISHSKDERIANMSAKINLEHVFVRHITPFKSEILFLFKGQACNRGAIVNNYTKQAMDFGYFTKLKRTKYSDKLAKSDWEIGKWIEEENEFSLIFQEGRTLTKLKVSSDPRRLHDAKKCYFLVEDHNLISDLILFHSVISNRGKMESNLRLKRVAVNGDTFGEGDVFKPFCDQ